MSFFSQFLHFLKNAHPIKNFAKPMPGHFVARSTAMATNVASVPISYEAIKAEVVETPHISEYQEAPTYGFEESFHTFETPAEVEVEKEMNGEEVAAPTVVIRKLAVRPEESLVLEQTVEEPLAPETVISQIIDLPLYQDEPALAETSDTEEAQSAEPVVAETETVIDTISIVVPEEPAKKIRKTSTKKSQKITKASTKTKAPAKKSPKASASKKTSATKAKKTVSRKKAPTPKEAMGFGF